MNTEYVKAFYEYANIPLWFFDQGVLSTHFINNALETYAEKLSDHISSIYGHIKAKHTDPEMPLFYPRGRELYFSIFSERYLVVGGPILLSDSFSTLDNLAFSFAPYLSDEECKNVIENLPKDDLDSLNSCIRLLMFILNGKAPSLDSISKLSLNTVGPIATDQFISRIFENTEDESFHTPYSHEVALLSCIKEGDIKRLEETSSKLPSTKYGKMSDNPIRQMLYGSIANVTLVTRYAIEGGLPEEEAFTLSDMYINRFDSCKNLFELDALNKQMVRDFTERVSEKRALNDANYSLAVRSCIRYIYTHNHSNISLEELSAEVGLSSKYISSLFKKEVGVGLSAFVENKKIEEAKNLLKYSPYSYGEISEYLSFASQSYFIKIFRKHTGLTPRQYRESSAI